MRIKLNYLILALVCMYLTSNVLGQSSEEIVSMNTTSRLTSQYAEEVVADFDGHEITLGEFEQAYAKNVGGVEAAQDDSLDEYERFLDLYVTYRMKLRNAFVRGYHNDEDLTNELNDYKQKIGVSYLEEKSIVAPGVKKFYDQRGEEVRVSHIMFKIGNPADSAKERAEAILDSIKNGASFEDMAAKYSDDKFSAKKGGDIYWFTAGQIIASFESAAYATPSGEVYTEVVKTKFGYHLLKVTDRQKRKYKIAASHILIKTDGNAENDSSNARQRINEISDAIKDGASFDSLAIEFSEDPGSGKKGGALGYFERRQMVQPFDEAVFQLEVGEVSPIVKTRFGYHIIKLTDVQEYPPFEKEIEKIRDMYKKSRYQFDYDEYINKLKKEFAYSVNENTLDLLSKEENQILLSAEYMTDSSFVIHKNEKVISINKNDVLVDSLMSFMNSQASYKNKALNSQLLKEGTGKFGNELLLIEKASQLESTDSEFAKLMSDYRNGIYIFKLQEDEVWNKVKIDSTELRKLYEENKENYKTTAQVSFSEIFSKKKEDIDQYFQMLEGGKDFDSLASKYTARPGMKNKSGNYGLKNVDDSEMSIKANTLSEVGSYSESMQVKGGWAIVKLNEKVESRIKTYEEALPEISSSYQESESKRLEKAYNDRLKALYQPEYFYNELANAYK
ncbi:MAG: peptidylprolyl isomerase [Bacteroidota bacterium]